MDVKTCFMAEFCKRSYHLKAIANQRCEPLAYHTQDGSIKTFSPWFQGVRRDVRVDKDVNSYESAGVQPNTRKRSPNTAQTNEVKNTEKEKTNIRLNGDVNNFQNC